jgi:uncharacterized protein HemY
MGHLRMLQQKYDDAEEYYRKALALYQNGDKDAPELAASLATLGKLFAEERRTSVEFTWHRSVVH